MIRQNIMHSFDEYVLIPKVLSPIESRQEIDTLKDGYHPILISPMTSFMNPQSFKLAKNNKLIPIVPVEYEAKSYEINNNDWKSMTLSYFNWYYNQGHAKEINSSDHILIDVANGHMEKLLTSIKEAKKRYPNLVIMAGNIGNHETYLEYCKAGVDYVRVGIGGGSGCTTSVLTGMHESVPELLLGITEIRKNIHKNEYGYELCYAKDTYTSTFGGTRYYLGVSDPIELKCLTKVIADGGINTIDKGIKALAMGADYIMIGKMFAQCKDVECKKYYGQASEQGQIDRFGYVKNEPEGKEMPLEYQWETVSKFVHQFDRALRSAMSYAGARTLDEFHPDIAIQSISEFNSYHK